MGQHENPLLIHNRKKLEKTSLDSTVVDLIMSHSGKTRKARHNTEGWRVSAGELLTLSDISARNRLISKVLGGPKPGSFNHDIAAFLSRRREVSDNESIELAGLLTSFNFKNFEKTSLPSFRNFICSGPRRMGDYFKAPREEIAATKVLLYSILELSFSKLGASDTFKFFNEAVGLYLEGYFDKVEDPIESLVKAILYCENNSDYPIDWILENIFPDSAAKM